MTPITTAVVNTRLNETLNLHLIGKISMIDFDRKIVQGQIQSFKSPQIVDAVNADGNIQPTNVSVFTLSFTNTTGLQKQVQDYIEANIESLTSK